MHKINWDDLRYVLAVAKEGSAAGAARALNVNHSTVIRRIRSFEKAQGLRLFDHLASGYRLTVKGEAFLNAARSIDETITELERKIIGGDNELAGNIRITTTDGLYPILIDSFADFRRAYPKITLDILITNVPLNLDTIDADIAIRPTLTPPPNLVGRQVCDLAFAIYGAESLKKNGVFESVYGSPWLGLNGPLASSVPGKWLSETVADELVTVRCNSFIPLLGLVEQSLGFAVLPCCLGDKSTSVCRVMPEPLAFRNQIWLLSHADVLRSKRVRSCVNFFYHALRAKQRLLEGVLVTPA